MNILLIWISCLAILPLYVHEKLGYNENDAAAVYHGFNMMICAMCVFGGIVSDLWLGKFRTIVYFSIFYVIGFVTLPLGAIPAIGFSPKILLFAALALISIGCGGISPCVPTFGGDQFKLPEQAVQLGSFFSLYYFSCIFGALISTTILPILRFDVHCFGEVDCYPLAFGMSTIFLIVAIGKPFFIE